MLRATLPIALAVAALAAPSTASALDEQGYWAVADRLQTQMNRYWDDRVGHFTGTFAGANADALLVYSVAARSGHRGPARDDARARRLVDALVSSPPYTATLPPPRAGSLRHAPGFTSSMESTRAPQHMVFDTEIVDGLRHAWLARRELGLSARQSALIAGRIHSTARGSFYRWPAIRLNQINWYALMYAADATVTGDARMLRRDLKLQIARFVAGARAPGATAGNLGVGLNFHYLPHMRPSHPMNVDSAEYANITASFAREYAQARRAGMPAPSPAARRLLRAWLTRVVTGYWTHGGYVNWDTGFGFRRWHQAKKFGISQQALIGIASAPGLVDDRTRRWAKWMLDRGFDFYERQLGRESAPPGVFFGVREVPQASSSARLALARVASNAARAVAAGLGTARSGEPPGLYAFDPETGRLAVTTPDYNTVIVPSSRGAFPYGGIDVARLFDGRQEVAAGIGGRPPASFGLLVRDISGRRTFATQIHDRGRLWLTRAPHGVGARSSAWTGRSYAGAFQDLRAAGIARGSGWTGRSTHRFTHYFIQTNWSLRRISARGRATVDVLFPSWGADAEVEAIMRDDTVRRVGRVRIPLARIAHLQVKSRHGAYVVYPRTRPRGATVHLLRTSPQSSAPRPGPTLAVQIARESGARTARFSARYAPVESERAAETAARLANDR